MQMYKGLLILVCLLLTACGWSVEDIDATVVAALENQAATQTAEVTPTSTPTLTPTPTATPTPTPTPIPPTETPKPIKVYGTYVSRSGYKIVFPNSWIRCTYDEEEDFALDMCADDLSFIDWIGVVEDDTISLGFGPMTFEEWADIDYEFIAGSDWDVFDLIYRYQMYQDDRLWEIKEFYYGPEPGIWYNIRGLYAISDARFLIVIVGTNRNFADRANDLFFEILDQLETGHERTDPLGFHSWEIRPIDIQEG